MKQALIDTGPIVAFLNRRDRHHEWARTELSSLRPPLLTCEPVLAEACFLLRNTEGGADAVLELVARDLLRVQFEVAEEIEALRSLMKKYASVPMSLADACLVRATELHKDSTVLTLDEDFRVYRRNRGQAIPVIMPS
ncbi:MAG: PIN domain-containing protein [Deltaproteobacteria bacterium]|nr:PIN domain-containing protein [Deltaproteobacteria bacterium]